MVWIVSSNDIECERCLGTGVYRGLFEGPGIGVVCPGCEGTGNTNLILSIERKTRDDIKYVHQTTHTIYPESEWFRRSMKKGPSKAVTYQEFLKGKKP